MLARTEPLTVSQIAANVAKSDALERAEAAAREAAERHDVAAAAVRAAASANHDHRRDADVIRLADEERRAAKVLHAAMEKAAPLRTAHGAKLAAALRPARVEAARKLLDLFAEMEPGFQMLQESARVINRLGGKCSIVSLDFSNIQRTLRGIAGES